MKQILMRNPVGDDINNCTIISLSLAAGIPYKKANEIGIKAGREKNKGFYLEPLYEKARQKGIQIKKIPVDKGTTLKQFISDFPIGRFVVSKYAHAFCIINGRVHDTINNGMNSKIEEAYRFDVDTQSQLKKYYRDHYFY